MAKSSVEFTTGQRAWLDAQQAEPEHTVAVTGAITKVEELGETVDDAGNITPPRVRFTVTGDNGVATYEAVPPMSPEEREAADAQAAAEAEEANAAAAAERELEASERAEAARSAQEEADAARTKALEEHIDKKVAEAVTAELDRRAKAK